MIGQRMRTYFKVFLDSFRWQYISQNKNGTIKWNKMMTVVEMTEVDSRGEEISNRKFSEKLWLSTET